MRQVFQALWERWESRLWLFHGFHSAAVSTALFVKMSFLAFDTPKNIIWDRL
jgi:hypothetical protein